MIVLEFRVLEFVANSHLLNWQLYNFLYICTVILNHFYIDLIRKPNNLSKHSKYSYCFLWKIENCFFTSFFSSFLVAFSAQSLFPLNLICCITFGLASSVCCYVNLLQSTYNFLRNKGKLVKNQLRNHHLDQ